MKLVLNEKAAQIGINMQFLQAPKLLYVFPHESAQKLKELSGNR